jgi:hypothetical protein
MCFALATGRNWFNVPTKQSRVAFVAGEGRNGIILRLQGLNQHYRTPVEDEFFHIIPRPIKVNIEREVTQLLEAFDRIKFAPQLIVFDTKSANMEGSDNDAAIINQFIDQLRRIERYHHCTILIIDHTGHGFKTRPRGASHQMGAADGVYMVEYDKETEEGKFYTSKDPKDSPTPNEIRFTRTVIDLNDYSDEEGNPLTTLILREGTYSGFNPNDYPELNKLNPDRVSAFEVLLQLYQAHARNAEDSNATPMVLANDWKEELIRRGLINAKDAESQRYQFREIRTALRNKGMFTESGAVGKRDADYIVPLIRKCTKIEENNS